jgi:hypothetical protein
MKFTTTKGGLVPYDDAAWAFISSRSRNPLHPVELEHLHDRDMVEHRRIFAVINELAKALGRDEEVVRAELLYLTGNFHVIGGLFGKLLVSINSMSRRHMTDHELHAFWDDAVEIIRREMLTRSLLPDGSLAGG